MMKINPHFSVLQHMLTSEALIGELP